MKKMDNAIAKLYLFYLQTVTTVPCMQLSKGEILPTFLNLRLLWEPARFLFYCTVNTEFVVSLK